MTRFLSLIAALAILTLPSASAQSLLPDVERAALDAGASTASAQSLVKAATIALSENQRLSAVSEAGGRFAWSVAFSGNTALLGAPSDEVAGKTNAGAVYVFTLSGGTWTQTHRLIAGDASEAAAFGYTVALDGDRALFGATFDDHGGISDAGSAYVFERSGATWTQRAKLTAGRDAAANDLFGWSIALDGARALIGSVGHDARGLADAGSAYVFDLDTGNNRWKQVQKLTASDASFDFYFGWSVALDGDRAVVGVLSDDHSGTDAGSAYVFDRAGVSWVYVVRLVAGDRSAVRRVTVVR